MDMFVKTIIFMAVPLSDVLHFPNCHQAGDAFSGSADGGQMEWSRLCSVKIYEIYDDGLLCNEANYTYINTYIICIPQLPYCYHRQLVSFPWPPLLKAQF